VIFTFTIEKMNARFPSSKSREIGLVPSQTADLREKGIKKVLRWLLLH
jgi:hypothetical protein